MASFMIVAASAFGQTVVDGRIINQNQVVQQPQGGVQGLVYGPNGLCDQYRAQQQGEAVKPGVKPEGQWHQLHGADTPNSLKAYGAVMNVVCPPATPAPTQTPAAPSNGNARKAY